MPPSLDGRKELCLLGQNLYFSVTKGSGPCLFSSANLKHATARRLLGGISGGNTRQSVAAFDSYVDPVAEFRVLMPGTAEQTGRRGFWPARARRANPKPAPEFVVTGMRGGRGDSRAQRFRDLRTRQRHFLALLVAQAGAHQGKTPVTRANRDRIGPITGQRPFFSPARRRVLGHGSEAVARSGAVPGS